ncbi:MAG: response regulator transcription factor [Phaeodactylibacter sp.]|nr:response regulator transcription factor [Phaeodactylibacter sp.]
MKVLLIEDEKNIASFIERSLASAGYEACVAYDGETGLDILSGQDFDVIILDIILPRKNGWEVCQHIRQQYRKDTPILMLSALNHTNHVVKGLEAGADDYMAKPFKLNELIARLHALVRRYRRQMPANRLLQYGGLEVNLESKEAFREGRPIKLTIREFKLLEFFMRNPGKALSRFELLEKVWGLDFDTGTNVVDVYVNYLRNKIDKGYTTKLIHTVYGMGYILKEGHDSAE